MVCRYTWWTLNGARVSSDACGCLVHSKYREELQHVPWRRSLKLSKKAWLPTSSEVVNHVLCSLHKHTRYLSGKSSSTTTRKMIRRFSGSSSTLGRKKATPTGLHQVDSNCIFLGLSCLRCSAQRLGDYCFCCQSPSLSNVDLLADARHYFPLGTRGFIFVHGSWPDLSTSAGRICWIGNMVEWFCMWVPQTQFWTTWMLFLFFHLSNSSCLLLYCLTSSSSTCFKPSEFVFKAGRTSFTVLSTRTPLMSRKHFRSWGRGCSDSMTNLIRSLG